MDPVDPSTDSGDGASVGWVTTPPHSSKLSSLEEPMLDAAVKSPGVNRMLVLLCAVLGVIAIGCAVGLGVVAHENKNQSPSQSSQQATIPTGWLRMFALSDVHLDILYSETASALGKPPCQNDSALPTFRDTAPFGRVGCDASQKLFESALASLQRLDQTEKADVILVTGDKSGHNLYNSLNGSSNHGRVVLEAQAQFTETLLRYFPARRHILTMGNNDVPYHWQIPTASWYQQLWSYWAPLILCSDCEAGRYEQRVDENEFNGTFLRGGYYKAQVSDGLVMLVVNSLYWTSYAWATTKPFRNDIPEVANEQMQWLTSELKLARAAGRKVVVVGHVPPGLDPYRPNLTKVGLVRQFWFDNYTQSFLQLVGETYSDVLACNVFAHLHKDDFHVHSYNSDNSTRSATLLLSSISPVYENNPAYRVMFFNPAGWHLADYTQYWTDLVQDNTRQSSALWKKQYTFSEAYPGAQRIDSARLQQIWQDIMSLVDSFTWQKFMQNRQIYTANTLNSYSRDHLYCIAYSANVTAYADCRKAHPYEARS